MASNNNISITFKIQDEGDGFKTLTANADSLKKIMTESIVEADKLKIVL